MKLTIEMKEKELDSNYNEIEDFVRNRKTSNI